MNHTILLTLVAIGLLSLTSQWLAWNTKGHLMVMSVDSDWKPEAGWTIASLELAKE